MTANLVQGANKIPLTLWSVSRNQKFGLTLSIAAPINPEPSGVYDIDIFDDTGIQIVTETGWTYLSKSYTFTDGADGATLRNYQLNFGGKK
jgi:hypothetical protein